MGTSGSHSSTVQKEGAELRGTKLCRHASCLNAEAASWLRVNKEVAAVVPHTELGSGPSL